MLCVQIIWLVELGFIVFMVLYSTPTQSQSKRICCVPLNHRTEYVHDLAPNLQCIKVFHLDYRMLPLLLCFLLCNHYPFTSILAGESAASISVVY